MNDMKIICWYDIETNLRPSRDPQFWLWPHRHTVQRCSPDGGLVRPLRPVLSSSSCTAHSPMLRGRVLGDIEPNAKYCKHNTTLWIKYVKETNILLLLGLLVIFFMQTALWGKALLPWFRTIKFDCCSGYMTFIKILPLGSAAARVNSVIFRRW